MTHRELDAIIAGIAPVIQALVRDEVAKAVGVVTTRADDRVRALEARIAKLEAPKASADAQP